MDEVRNFVAGEWTTPSGEVGQTVTDSATGEPVAETRFSTAADVDAAVAAANEAFEEWRHRPVEERVQPLFQYKALLEEHQDDIAATIVREHGKTLSEARGELRRGIENVEVACGMPSLLQAGSIPNAAPDIDETAVRLPLGTFAAITPFNFPGMIPLWFLPYAVGAGNAFVLKPSESTPLTAQYLVELLTETDLPDGVVSLVHGGPDTVNALLAHDGIVGASFVGSTPVAKHVYETAAAHGKRVQAQGGAKNHVVVSEHAPLDAAVDGVLGSAFANTGQRCLANPVAVVHDAVYDEFVERLLTATDAMTVGPGSEDPDMGPMVSAAAADRVREAIEAGVAEDATLLRDGREDAFGDLPETFLGPTVFGDVGSDTDLAREEIFGPVLAVVRVPDFDAAIEAVNASAYGNAASLFTRRGGEARRFRHEVEAGNVAINAGTAAPMAFFHFGGRKASFFGDLHAQGDDAIRFYTDETVYIERWLDE